MVNDVKHTKLAKKVVSNMISILRIDVSARTERSLTRGLSQRFIDKWLKRRPSDEIIQRDIGLQPPPAVS